MPLDELKTHSHISAGRLWDTHPALNLPLTAHWLWHLLLGQLGWTFLLSSYPGEGSTQAGLIVCVKPAMVCGLPSQGTGGVKPTSQAHLTPFLSPAKKILGCGILPLLAFHLGCKISVSLVTPELQD